MSVINQMLKDLDNRENESKQVQHVVGAVPTNTSTKKIIVWVVFTLVLLNGLGLFIWQLYNENNRLKQQSFNNVGNITEVKTERLAQPEKATEKPQVKTQGIADSATKKHSEGVQQQKTIAATREVTHDASRGVEVTPELPPEKPLSHTYLPVAQNAVNDKPHNEANKAKKPEQLKQQKQPKQAKRSASENKQSSMSVSRRQLTEKELVAKKIRLAEKALDNNDVAKAEKLFEEVLFVQPKNQFARTKLAALWFGRQAYQPAVNLLSQGIALDPNNANFRLMKARIFLNKGQPKAALEVLKGFKGKADNEYQSLMANIAQQSGDYKTAVKTYEQLLANEPQSARWWLGLAIAHDSDADYSKAIEAYHAALALGNLSQSSADFAQQRMLELGE